jgi:hypothetical protein
MRKKFIFISQRFVWMSLIVLLLFTVSRLSLWYSLPSDPLGRTWRLFFTGIRFDLRWSVLLCIPVLVGSATASYTGSLRLKRITNVYDHLLIASLLVLLVIDYFYFRYTYARLNFSILELMRPFPVALKMMWQSYPAGWLIAMLVLIHLTLTRAVHQLAGNFQKGYHFNLLQGFMLLLLTFYAVWGTWKKYPLTWSDAYAHGQNGALALNPAESLFYSLFYGENEHSVPVSKIDSVRYHSQFVADSVRGKQMQGFSGDFKRLVNQEFNVVILLAESLASYKTSLGNPELTTTPFLKNLSEQSLWFTRCFSPHYGTARAVWNLYSGTPDVNWKSLATHRIPEQPYPSAIAELPFRSNLYLLGGEGNWADIKGYLHHVVPSIQVFDGSDLPGQKTSVWGIDDDALLQESNKVFSQQRKPFFAVVQTSGNHRPYTIPSSAQQNGFILEPTPSNIENLGFESEAEWQSLRYLDFCLNRFFQSAQKENYYNQTLFIVVGDHGTYGNAAAAFGANWNQYELRMLHVPLLFFQPQMRWRQKDSVLCSIMDLLPTIAGLKNQPIRHGRGGVDLLGDTSRKGLFFMIHDTHKMGWISNDGYCIANFVNGGLKHPVYSHPSIKGVSDSLALSFYRYYKAMHP